MVSMFRAENSLHRSGLVGHLEQLRLKYDGLDDGPDNERTVAPGRRYY